MWPGPSYYIILHMREISENTWWRVSYAPQCTPALLFNSLLNFLSRDTHEFIMGTFAPGQSCQ